MKNRRVIYLSDKEWASIQDWAAEQGITASAFVRQAVDQLVNGHSVVADPVNRAIYAAGFGSPRPAPKRTK